MHKARQIENPQYSSFSKPLNYFLISFFSFFFLFLFFAYMYIKQLVFKIDLLY